MCYANETKVKDQAETAEVQQNQSTDGAATVSDEDDSVTEEKDQAETAEVQQNQSTDGAATVSDEDDSAETDAKDISKPHKFDVFFPNLNKSCDGILKLLERQNKGLITKSWTILKCKAKYGGTVMKIGVDKESFEFMRRKSNKLSCGMGTAVFSVIN